MAPASTDAGTGSLNLFDINAQSSDLGAQYQAERRYENAIRDGQRDHDVERV